MLDMNHSGDGSQQGMQELWQQMYSKYYPTRTGKVALNVKSFGGIDKRRKEDMVSTILFDNLPLLKHLQGLCFPRRGREAGGTNTHQVKGGGRGLSISTSVN